ncbi:MAG: AsmA family protein [Rhodospirillales bacterium]|nr:AsmA family protein [Rhodospirillales bacterium]
MLRKLFIGIGALVVIIVVAGGLIPLLVDANRFKGEVLARLAQAVGRPVAIEGALSLALLPMPALSVERLTLGNVKGARAPEMIRVERAELRLDLLALLQGNFALDRVTLDRPTIAFEILADGKPNWSFESMPASSSPPSSATTVPKSEPSGGATASTFGVERLEIRNGTLSTLDHRSGESHRAQNVDLTLGLRSLTGPFRLKGEALVDGVLMRIEAGLESLKGERAAPLDVEFFLPRAEIALRFSGLVSRLSAGYTARGKLAIEGKSLGALTGLVAPGGEASASSFGLEANLSVSPQAIDLGELVLVLGKDRGRGKLRVDLQGKPNLQGQLAFETIGLDPMFAGRPAAQGPSPVSTPAKEAAAPPGAPPQASAGVGSLLPRGVNGALDLRVGALAYQGAAFRDLRANLALTDGELTLSQASLQLPQGGEVSLFGFLTENKEGLLFEGTLEAAGDNLRATLAAFKQDVGGLAPTRLKKFKMLAAVRGTTREVRLTDLDVRLDESRLLGAATYRPGPRPALGLSLGLDRLDLDSYLAASTPVAKGPASPGVEKKSATVATGSSPSAASAFPALAQLKGFDANIRAKVGALSYKGSVVQDAVIDGSLIKGQIQLREAGFADLAGLQAKIVGGLEGLADGAPTFKDLTLDLRSRTPARTARFLGVELPIAPDKLGTVALRARLNGTPQQIAFDAQSELAGGAIKAQGTAIDPLTQPRFDLTVEASHASLLQLVRLFAEGWRPVEANPGAFAFAAKLKGDAQKFDLADLRARIGRITLAGQAGVVLGGNRPKITAALNADEIALDPFLPARRQAFLPQGWRGWLGQVSLSQPAAFGISKMPSPPPSWLKAALSERWSREAINLTALNALDLRLDLNAGALLFEKYRIDKPQIALALNEGRAVLSKFNGSLFGGGFALNGALSAQGAPTLTAALGITKANIRQALFDTAGVSLADGQFDLTMNVVANGRSMADWVARLAGDGKIAAREGRVQGFDLKAVTQRLNNLDNLGSVLALLQGGMSGGSTRFSTLDGNFKIENGVATSTDLRLNAEGGQGTGTVTADLPQWLLDARARFQLTEPAGVPPFGLRLDGPIDAPRRIIEANELVNWLGAKGLSKALKGKGGKNAEALQQILGGAKSAPTEPSTESPAPDSTKDKKKGGLKGFLKDLNR